MGSATSQETPLCSPLGCIRQHWSKFGGDPLTREKLKRYCNQWWPQYQLEDGERWPENRSLKCSTILQLMLFCHRMEKWDELPYIDALMTLYIKTDIQKKGGKVHAMVAKLLIGWWPENGLLPFNIVLLLMLFCCRFGKCWCFCRLMLLWLCIETQVFSKSVNEKEMC